MEKDSDYKFKSYVCNKALMCLYNLFLSLVFIALASFMAGYSYKHGIINILFIFIALMGLIVYPYIAWVHYRDLRKASSDDDKFSH